MANNYSILGLKDGASISEIKSRYRTLSKQLHPDLNGGDEKKTERFIIVIAAYQALLSGDIGEQKQQKSSNYQQGGKTKKTATYRFDTINKDDKSYLIRFNLSGVEKITIKGKNYTRVATYDTYDVDGYTNLILSFEDAKKAEYVFRITLLDGAGNYAEVTYKVTPPKVGLYQKFKNLFK